MCAGGRGGRWLGGGQYRQEDVGSRANWAVENNPDIDAHPAAYDARRGT
jgi:hypothetical protein